MNTAPRAIHHLNCGTMCPRGARMLTGAGGWLEPARLVCHCLLIEGAEGLVLVDSGFGLDDVRKPRQLGRAATMLLRPRLSAADTAISQVRELGFDPHDVRHIITTHLDLDHAGGLPDFPDAHVHLLGRELHAALHPSLSERATSPRTGRTAPTGSSTPAAASSGTGSTACASCPAATPRSC
jgi:glyoxylase-like metal-dependent hydrolase (beta-lactamase superfamily II)